MNIVISRGNLFSALQQVIGVVERRQSLPILGNVFLRVNDDQLELRTTDLEIQIGCAVQVQNLEPGAVTAPARKLYDICRGLPEGSEIELQEQEGRLRVKSGRSRYVLATLPAADFPELEQVEGQTTFEIPGALLKSLIVRTQFAMAQQDVRYYLNGLLLEVADQTMRAVATDGHRLAVSEETVESTSEASGQYIVPRKTVLEIVRLLDAADATVKLGLAAGQLVMHVNDCTLVSKLVDGSYPEYRRVIPESGDHRAIANREAVKQALTRAAILSNEKFRGVRVGLSKGAMRIETQNPDQEEAFEEVSIAYEGEDLTIGFNVTYLLDALNAMNGEEFILEMRGPDASGLIYDEKFPQHKYVVMPMRL